MREARLARFARLAASTGFILASAACVFPFEVTSQRTALENQVMGAYKELDDDLVLVSSVRGPGGEKTKLPPTKKRALDARQNQDFNKDDIEELKDKGLLGEASDGTLALLPKGIGSVEGATAVDLKLANQLVEEENRDRGEVWKRIIAGNENLSDKDLQDVRSTYAKMQRESAGPGQWYQDQGGSWQKKIGKAALEPAETATP